MIERLINYLSNKTFISIGLAFFILSVEFSFWITRLPDVKVSLGLSELDLGVALFFLPLGAIISMLLSGRLINKIGEGKTTIYATLFYSFVVFCPFLAFDFYSVCLALFILGFAMGWLDIAMNSVAGTIEKQHQVSIMSTSHGFFSLGGMIGAALGGLLAAAKVDIFLHLGITFIIVMVVLFGFMDRYIGNVKQMNSDEKPPLFAIPVKPVYGIAIIAFCIMIGEGAIADWSAIYLRDFIGSSAYVSGFGYAAFSLTMTLGRFNGDFYVDKYGRLLILITGASIALIGLLLLLATNSIIVILGFSLVGLGYSCIVPVIFSSAAKVKGLAPAHGIASVASAGYFGFLIGPVIIGIIAEYQGLNMAFMLLFGLTLISLFSAKKALKSN
ncbi:MAG: MFS transporter, partial [Bacteroidota bacterium]